MLIAYNILAIYRFPGPKKTACLFELRRKETKRRHFHLSQIRDRSVVSAWHPSTADNESRQPLEGASSNVRLLYDDRMSWLWEQRESIQTNNSERWKATWNDAGCCWLPSTRHPNSSSLFFCLSLKMWLPKDSDIYEYGINYFILIILSLYIWYLYMVKKNN